MRDTAAARPWDATNSVLLDGIDDEPKEKNPEKEEQTLSGSTKTKKMTALEIPKNVLGIKLASDLLKKQKTKIQIHNAVLWHNGFV
jgi:hypothetical protein